MFTSPLSHRPTHSLHHGLSNRLSHGPSHRLSHSLSPKKTTAALRRTASLCLTLTAGLALVACLMPLTAMAKEADTAKQVTVLGRTWVVAPVPETTGLYRATRLNTELMPYRPPAVLSARQALRAFHSATGCTPIRNSFYRDITGAYFTTLDCAKNQP